MNMHLTNHKHYAVSSLMADYGRKYVGQINYYSSLDSDTIHSIINLSPEAIAELSEDVRQWPDTKLDLRQIWFSRRSHFDVDMAIIELFGDDYKIE
jgi:hypothetical protein